MILLPNVSDVEEGAYLKGIERRQNLRIANHFENKIQLSSSGCAKRKPFH